MSGSATYLYAVIRASSAAALAPELNGIDGGQVRIIPAGEVACAVSTVGLDEFGEGPLQRNLEDLAWLERVAREHDAVVHALARHTTTVPLRLGAVYLDDDSAVAHVRRLEPTAVATLDVLEGREEWGVKVYAVPPRRDTGSGAADRPSSGLDYLRRRRAELERKAEDASASAADADAVFERLRSVAVLARRHRPQDPVLSGVPHAMVLNAAFLVDRDAGPPFRREVESLAAARPEGAVVLTGPWPPYSFATLDGA
jgi:hypothetical protein